MSARRRTAGGAGRGAFAAAIIWLGVLVAGVAAPAVRADGREISIGDAGFDPPTLTVSVGEPVTWTNDTTDSVAVITADGSMDSGQLAPGETFGHVFAAPGTVDYFLGGNPRVRAAIIVEGPGGSATTDAGGNPLLLVGVSLLAAIAVGGAIATLIGASRRSRR